MTFIAEHIARLLPSLALSVGCACCACLASTTPAQAAEIAATVTAPLPADMMRSAGQWIGKTSFDNLPDTGATSSTTASAPAALHFKPAVPGWIGVLDAASFIAPAFTETRVLGPIRHVNNYNAPLAPDHTNGPAR